MNVIEAIDSFDLESSQDIYYRLIEQAADLEQCDSNEKLEELAEGVFREMIGV